MRRLAAKAGRLPGVPRIVAPASFGVGSAAVAAAPARRGTGRRRGFGRMARSPDHSARTSLSEQRLRAVRRNAGGGTAGEGLRGHAARGEIDNRTTAGASLSFGGTCADWARRPFGRLGSGAASVA